MRRRILALYDDRVVFSVESSDEAAAANMLLYLMRSERLVGHHRSYVVEVIQ